MNATRLSIGQLAAATGIAVSAVRYYDEIGLVSAAAREGGKRRFDPSAVGRINFVQQCQAAGFSLDEIGLVLDDTQGGWRQLVGAKITELASQRDALTAMIETLEEVRACGCEIVANCTYANVQC